MEPEVMKVAQMAAIFVAVERISESQRFISRLLGERNQESAKLPQ